MSDHSETEQLPLLRHECTQPNVVKGVEGKQQQDAVITATRRDEVDTKMLK